MTSMLELEEENRAKANRYFDKTIFPMLTPMVFDTFHVFPVLMNKTLILGVVTKASGDEKELPPAFIDFVEAFIAAAEPTVGVER